MTLSPLAIASRRRSNLKLWNS